MRKVAAFLSVAGCFTLGAGAQPANLRTLDVCTLVPGATVAGVVGGRLVGTLPFRADDGTVNRCRYTVAPAGAEGDARDVYTVWVLHPDDFTGLKDGEEKPVTDVPGLSDGAFMGFHKEEGRHWLTVLVLRRATFQVTGESADAVRKIANVILPRLRARSDAARP
jgi:hypothetical protein